MRFKSFSFWWPSIWCSLFHRGSHLFKDCGEGLVPQAESVRRKCRVVWCGLCCRFRYVEEEP